MDSKKTYGSEIGNIISLAFFYWRKTFLYQFLFGVLYLSILVMVLMNFAEYYGILSDYIESTKAMGNGIDAYSVAQKKIMQNPNYESFSWVIIGVLIFLYPLNMGLFKMFRKIEIGDKLLIQDLFSGYSGINFFIFGSFYFFWFMVFSIAMPTVFLAIIWVALTIFTAPLMYFKGLRIFQTFNYNVQAWKKFFLEMLVCLSLAIFIKISALFTIIALPFVFGFTNAMIYSLYRVVFRENK